MFVNIRLSVLVLDFNRQTTTKKAKTLWARLSLYRCKWQPALWVIIDLSLFASSSPLNTPPTLTKCSPFGDVTLTKRLREPEAFNWYLWISGQWKSLEHFQWSPPPPPHSLIMFMSMCLFIMFMCFMWTPLNYRDRREIKSCFQLTRGKKAKSIREIKVAARNHKQRAKLPLNTTLRAAGRLK